MPLMMIHPDGTVTYAPRRFQPQDPVLTADRRFAEESFKGVVGDLRSDDPEFEDDNDTGGNA